MVLYILKFKPSSFYLYLLNTYLIFGPSDAYLVSCPFAISRTAAPGQRLCLTSLLPVLSTREQDISRCSDQLNGPRKLWCCLPARCLLLCIWLTFSCLHCKAESLRIQTLGEECFFSHTVTCLYTSLRTRTHTPYCLGCIPPAPAQKLTELPHGAPTLEIHSCSWPSCSVHTFPAD